MNATESCHLLPVNASIAYLYTPFHTIFVLVLVPIICSLGLLLNLAFLFVVYRVREMRTTTNFYLSNLAAADGCVLINAALQYLWSYAESPMYFNVFNLPTPAACLLPNLLIYVCYFASIFIVTFVTGERYLAICHVLKFQASKKRTLSLCAISWTLSAIIAGFQATYSSVQYVCATLPGDKEMYSRIIPYCTHRCTWCAEVVTWADLCQYLVAVPAVVYMSIAMMIQVKRPIVISETVRSKKTTQTRSHVARMLIINATIFFCCLTPYEIINLSNITMYFNNEGLLSSNAKMYIEWIGRIAMLLNSAINPLVYSLVNPSYRRAFAQAWFCCCHIRNPRNSEYEMMNRSKMNISTAMTNNLQTNTANNRLQPANTCHTYTSANSSFNSEK